MTRYTASSLLYCLSRCHEDMLHPQPCSLSIQLGQSTDYQIRTDKADIKQDRDNSVDVMS